MRLQTNLFYIDEHSIGIFPLACQLSSCKPNATVLGSQRMTALQARVKIAAGNGRILAGAHISFCYLSVGNDVRLLPTSRHSCATTADRRGAGLSADVRRVKTAS